jgi:hypothetical protein
MFYHNTHTFRENFRYFCNFLYAFFIAILYNRQVKREVKKTTKRKEAAKGIENIVESRPEKDKRK